MCKITDKLVLCSCTIDIENVYELDNYWIFYRFAKDLKMEVLGMPILPAFVHVQDHAYNLENLPKLLNDINLFVCE